MAYLKLPRCASSVVSFQNARMAALKSRCKFAVSPTKSNARSSCSARSVCSREQLWSHGAARGLDTQASGLRPLSMSGAAEQAL